MNALCLPTGKGNLRESGKEYGIERYSLASTRHKVSNTSLLTKRFEVRFLFAEPDISDFELLRPFG